MKKEKRIITRNISGHNTVYLVQFFLNYHWGIVYFFRSRDFSRNKHDWLAPLLLSKLNLHCDSLILFLFTVRRGETRQVVQGRGQPRPSIFIQARYRMEIDSFVSLQHYVLTSSLKTASIHCIVIVIMIVLTDYGLHCRDKQVEQLSRRLLNPLLRTLQPSIPELHLKILRIFAMIFWDDDWIAKTKLLNVS